MNRHVDDLLARTNDPSGADRAFIHEAWVFVAGRAFMFWSVIQSHSIPKRELITESGARSVPGNSGRSLTCAINGISRFARKHRGALDPPPVWNRSAA